VPSKKSQETSALERAERAAARRRFVLRFVLRVRPAKRDGVARARARRRARQERARLRRARARRVALRQAQAPQRRLEDLQRVRLVVLREAC